MSYSRVIAGVGWVAGAKLVGQLASWLSTLLVMRILAPTDYGILAATSVVVGLSMLAAEFSLTSTLIHTRERDPAQLRAFEGFAIWLALAATLLLNLSAPLFEWFFRTDHLAAVLHAQSLNFLLAALAIVPDALLQRSLQFGRRAAVEVATTLVAAIGTLLPALAGWGVWALVIGPIAGYVTRTVSLMLAARRAPAPDLLMRADLSAYRHYSSPLTLSRLLAYLQNTIDLLVGSKLLSQTTMGHYMVANQWSTMPVGRVMNVLNQVAFPFLVEYRNEGRDVGQALVRSLEIVAFASVPFFWGLASAAPLVIEVLIGPKWAVAATPMTLLCCAMPLRLCNDFLPNAMQTIGRNQVLVANQLTSLAILPAAVFIGSQWGMNGLAGAMLMGITAASIINTRRCLAEFKLGVRRLFNGVWRTLIAGAIAALAVHAMLDHWRGRLPDLWLLLALALCGALIYAALQWLINRDQAQTLYSMLRGSRAAPAIEPVKS